MQMMRQLAAVKTDEELQAQSSSCHWKDVRSSNGRGARAGRSKTEDGVDSIKRVVLQTRRLIALTWTGACSKRRTPSCPCIPVCSTTATTQKLRGTLYRSCCTSHAALWRASAPWRSKSWPKFCIDDSCWQMLLVLLYHEHSLVTWQ